jgi:hypothetical protein
MYVRHLQGACSLLSYIIIIFDQNKLNEDAITNYLNNIHKHLEFKLTTEDDNNISYLDLSIHRANHSLQMEIYRKPTQTDTTIHFTANHPLLHKLAAYRFYINRMLSTPITDQARQHEWNTICTIAKNNGFPLHIIYNLNNKIKHRQYSHKYTTENMGHIRVPQSTHT